MEKDKFQFRQWLIPERMRPGILRYIEHGIIPGRFLQAVICNDLQAACGQADDINIYLLPAYVGYFYNHAPAKCWGSPKIMKAWNKKGGTKGR
jgi:hypothetical protein